MLGVEVPIPRARDAHLEALGKNPPENISCPPPVGSAQSSLLVLPDHSSRDTSAPRCLRMVVAAGRLLLQSAPFPADTIPSRASHGPHKNYRRSRPESHPPAPPDLR